MYFVLALLAALYSPDAAALGDDRFAVRDAAEGRLCRAGWLAHPALVAAGRSSDAEVRHRAGRLRGRLERDAAALLVLGELQWAMQVPSYSSAEGFAGRRPFIDWAAGHDPGWHVDAVWTARRCGLAPGPDALEPWNGGPPRPGWENPPMCVTDFGPELILGYWSEVRDWNARHPRKP